MGVLDLLVFFGFMASLSSFVAVAIVNKTHLGIERGVVAICIAVLISGAWSYMMYVINAKSNAALIRLKSKAKENTLFHFLFALNIVLVIAGASLSWALIPILKAFKLFS
jgi:hypothetical protein